MKFVSVSVAFFVVCSENEGNGILGKVVYSKKECR